MPDNRTYDRSVTESDGLLTGDDYAPIPFEDAPLPAAQPETLARPLVDANRRREMLARDGAGRDGSPEWYEQCGAPERQPSALALDIVMGR